MSWQLVVTLGGWLATVSLLLGYGLVSNGQMAGDGRTYQVLNVFGSIGLGVAAFAGRVWPSVALNGVWALIGLAALNRLRGSRPWGDAGRRQDGGALAHAGTDAGTHAGTQRQDGEASCHCAPSGVSRTSTPIAASRSRTRSEVA